MGTFLRVSFASVVAVVTVVSFTVVVVGGAVGDGDAMVAGATLWGFMLLVVLVGWGLWALIASAVRAIGEDRRRGEERRVHAETERRMRERGW